MRRMALLLLAALLMIGCASGPLLIEPSLTPLVYLSTPTRTPGFIDKAENTPTHQPGPTIPVLIEAQEQPSILHRERMIREEPEPFPEIPVQPFVYDEDTLPFEAMFFLNEVNLPQEVYPFPLEPAMFLDAFPTMTVLDLHQLADLLDSAEEEVYISNRYFREDVDQLRLLYGNEQSNPMRFIMTCDEETLWLAGLETPFTTITFHIVYEQNPSLHRTRPNGMTLALYFMRREGTWRLHYRQWFYEWHGFAGVERVILAEDGSCAFMAINPAEGTGTGSISRGVRFVNLLTGRTQLSYSVRGFDNPYQMCIRASKLYGVYQKTMPDGRIYDVLPKRFHLLTGIVQYAHWQEAGDRIVHQAQHTYVYELIPIHGTTEIVEVVHSLESPVNPEDNIAIRYEDNVMMSHEDVSELSVDDVAP